MMTPRPSLDVPIDPLLVPARSARRQEMTRLALVIPTLLAAAGIAVSLDGPSMILAIGVVMVFALAGAWYVQMGAIPADTVILVGRGTMASVIASSMETVAERGDRGLRVARAWTLDEAASLVRGANCDEIILAGDLAVERSNLTDARGEPVAVISGAEAIERMLGRVPVELVAQDRWFANLAMVRPLPAAYRRAKRALDIALALALAIVTLPVFILAALVIRLDSPGPILFRQPRMGLGGRPFTMIKFRSMRQQPERPVDGDWTKDVWTQESDPRITRAGKLLRVSRVDELPQLWNVLKGEMSFVGPRPEWVKSTAMLEQVLPDYPRRYAVRPGVTGWAQVRYRYTNSIDGQRKKLEYDLYYVKHASLKLDLWIMLRTALVVLRLKGK